MAEVCNLLILYVQEDVMSKQTLAAICIVMSMSTISILKADLDVFDICTAVEDQVEPDIDGNWIVWHDARNGPFDIYGYTLAEPNEIEVCTAGSDQRFVKVSGSIAVWQDERNGQRDIYAFNLLNRQPLDLPNIPRNDNVSQYYPDISGDTIVYRDRPDGTYNLFAYDIPSAASTQVSDASSTPTNYAIDGTLVVWMELVGSVQQVFYRDINTGDPAELVSESDYNQWYPAVSGNVIIWEEDRGTGTGKDLYGFDVSRPGDGDFPVCVIAGEQNRPDVSGNLVVWQDETKGVDDYDIWGMDLTTGGPFPIATDTQNDQNPTVSGRIVVWQRDNSDSDIVGAMIPSTTVLNVVLPEGGEEILAGTALTIDWQLVEGDEPAFVDLAFSPDNGANWETIDTDVPFDDIYVWYTEKDANSVTCRIRVSAAGDPSISAVSEAFTIFRCSADLTADVTGDCFVGIDDFAELAAQWLTCGHPYDENWCFN